MGSSIGSQETEQRRVGLSFQCRRAELYANYMPLLAAYLVALRVGIDVKPKNGHSNDRIRQARYSRLQRLFIVFLEIFLQKH